MPASSDLLDLKMLPAWAAETARPNDYSHVTGEEESGSENRGRSPRRENDRDRRPPRGPGGRPARKDRHNAKRPESDRAPREDRRSQAAPAPLPAVDVQFLPHAPALENVIAQIKSGAVAYSVFALARLFLEKPERYDVRLTGSADIPLFRIGEGGAVAVDRLILESSAFADSMGEFYEVETQQLEPLKGNFTNVARCRLSGTLLGPTNHHSYQPHLRSLYEQRFSRRMSFVDYQRQIEISSDPSVVEQWKEQARNVTTYRAKTGEPPPTFASTAEAERHFRQHHLPNLVHAVTETTIDGVSSRRLQDRALGRAVEDAWAREVRSPSRMMQELAGALRGAGLNIFRHRRGMLFVSPIRMRAFGHERAGVSASVNSILEKIASVPGINRKALAEQSAAAAGDGADLERMKLMLASDLHWLISEGYVVEFNDSTLDLPRTKSAVDQKTQAGAGPRATPHAEAPEPSAAESIDAGSNSEPTAPLASSGENSPLEAIDPIPPSAAPSERTEPADDANPPQ